MIHKEISMKKNIVKLTVGTIVLTSAAITTYKMVREYIKSRRIVIPKSDEYERSYIDIDTEIEDFDIHDEEVSVAPRSL